MAEKSLSRSLNSTGVASTYDGYYYAHNCGRPYQRDEGWLTFFNSIAERIVRDIGPGSVLDAGCAMGFLVEALRAQKVDATGIDLSEYAIGKAHEDVRPFIWVGSVTKRLPQRYDLIVCIEVLEHLQPNEADQAIENFCQHSDDILLSSTPFDYKEATHFNVRPPDYWAQRFAQHGFFRDLDFDGSFITPWTIRFRKTHDPAWRIVYGYERRLWQLEKEIQARRQLTIEQQTQLSENEKQIRALIDQAREEAQTYQGAALEITTRQETIASLTASLALAQEQSQKATAELTANQELIQGLTTELDEHKRIKDTLTAELQQEQERLQGQIAELSQQFNDRQSEHEAVKTFSAQLTAHIERVDSFIVPLAAGQSSLNTSLSELVERGEVLNGLVSELAEKQCSINALSEEITLREAELGERKATQAELESQLLEAKTTIESLQLLQTENEQALRKSSAALADNTHLIQQFRSREKGTEFAIAAFSQRLETLSSQLSEKEVQLADVNSSMVWYLYNRLKNPYLLFLFRFYERIKYPYLLSLYHRLALKPAPKPGFLIAESGVEAASERLFRVPEIEAVQPLSSHTVDVDLIVCAHNALDDVKRCLESVIRHTRLPYSLIIVDDGSNDETHAYLSAFAKSQNCLLIRNKEARGYTLAANQGLQKSQAQYVVLLNSDTVVTPLWLDRMTACGESDSRIGLVGPLSNAASWQSTPEISRNGDWAENKLPESFSAADMAKLVAEYSARLYPRIPFLNGFCLMIKRSVIDKIGYFDEAVFGLGYGEENDYCLRASEAGWELAIADDAYVYHAQSRSYSHDRRKDLSKRADLALAKKYDEQTIWRRVAICQTDAVLEGMRARNSALLERRQTIEAGMRNWEGKRVTFILTLRSACGGGNVVLDEAAAMRSMGIDVRILNLARNQVPFENGYPENTIPVVYAEDESQVGALTLDSDAVIATANDTVYWLKDWPEEKQPIKAYYIQDFEPYFSSPELPGFRVAWNSYTESPDLIRFTKTEWNAEAVQTNTGAPCRVIGPSVNVDLNIRRRRRLPDWPHRPLYIAAMIRPSTPRRNPAMTMEVLREVQRAHGETVVPILFGCASSDPDFLALPHDFAWRNAGVLNRAQVASLLNEVDIFVDFSGFQAMGLTAMEAMACGAAVIIPQKGGGQSFAEHERNVLVVDTGSKESCVAALERLTMDEQLRVRLQRQGLSDVSRHHPERAAYNLLNVLFPVT